MAIRRINSLGGISGTFENTITRYRNKKYVVYKKPEKINFSTSEAAVSARKRFAIAVKFAKLINSNKELSEIWKYAPVKGTNAYQKLIKYNASKVSNTGLTLQNIITPPGIEMNHSHLIFDSDELIFTSVVNANQPLFPLFVFILLYMRKGGTSELLLLSSHQVSINELEISGLVKPTEEEKKLIEQFDDIIVFAAFSFSKKRLREVCYSSTQTMQLSFLN